MSLRASKSKYVAGVQCHKLLWWKVHEPLAVGVEPDKVLQDRFDQGAQVGALARDGFPGGVLIYLFAPRWRGVRHAHANWSSPRQFSLGSFFQSEKEIGSLFDRDTLLRCCRRQHSVRGEGFEGFCCEFGGKFT